MTSKWKGGRTEDDTVDTVACDECDRWCWLVEAPFETIGEAFKCRSCARISDVGKRLAQRTQVLEEAVRAERDQRKTDGLVEQGSRGN